MHALSCRATLRLLLLLSYATSNRRRISRDRGGHLSAAVHPPESQPRQPPLNCPGGRTARAHAAGSHVVRADLATRDTGRLHDGADNSAVRHMGGTHSSDAIQNVDEAGWHPTAMEPAKRTPRRSRPRVLAESLFSAVDRKRPDATSVPLMRACDVPSPTTR